jgi:hypothetical protein
MATVAVRPVGAIPLPAKLDIGGVVDEATCPPEEGVAATEGLKMDKLINYLINYH